VRGLRKHVFDDHSRSKWDVTSTIGRERDEKVWIRRSLTIYIGFNKHDRRETAVNAWIRRSLKHSLPRWDATSREPAVNPRSQRPLTS
jgi:hypothetical protein